MKALMAIKIPKKRGLEDREVDSQERGQGRSDQTTRESENVVESIDSRPQSKRQKIEVDDNVPEHHVNWIRQSIENTKNVSILFCLNLTHLAIVAHCQASKPDSEETREEQSGHHIWRHRLRKNHSGSEVHP